MHGAIAICESRFQDMATVDGLDFAVKPSEARPFVNPSKMSDAEIMDLLERIEAGTVLSLYFAAEVFGARPNLNLQRPEPKATKTLAKTAPGTPYLSDHRSWSVDGKNGEIAGAKWVDDSRLIELFHVQAKPAMEALARGLHNRFSISYKSEGAKCSQCSTKAGRGWFGWVLQCDCTLGSPFEDPKTGEARITEIFTTGRHVMRETSTVVIPAYTGTALLDSFNESNRTGSSFFSIAPINILQENNTMSQNENPAPVESGEPAEKQTAPETPPAAEGVALSGYEAMKARAQAAEEHGFKLAFDAGVAALKFSPSDEAEQRAVWESLDKRDSVAYAARVAKKPANAAFAAEPSGGGAALPGDSRKPARPDGFVMDLAELMAREGSLKPDTITNHGARVMRGVKYSSRNLAH